MKKRWLKRLFALIISTAVALSVPFITLHAKAAPSDADGIEPYSIDTSFTLDFDESRLWTIDFSNSNYVFFNHQFVTVEYTSCSPYNSKAKVRVDLFIDEDEDGIYDPYDPNGEYTFIFTIGDKYSIALPYGTTAKKYRLVFANQTPSVSTGSFTVKTE